ncbi:MAG: alcohol dehydrogenase catalytic domain-containing protein [Chloroflexota bacterium]
MTKLLKYQPVVGKNISLTDQTMCRTWTTTDPIMLNQHDPNILIRICRLSICHSDRRVMQGGKDNTLEQKLILGHEAGGFVVDPGPYQNELEPGAKVVLLPHVTCQDNCKYCQNLKQNLCPHMRHLGFHLNGTMSDLIAVPRQCVFPVDDEFPMNALPLVEPLACVLRSLHRLEIKQVMRTLLEDRRLTDTLFTIYGGGPMGCLAALAVKRLWPDLNVKIIEPNDRRRNIIEQSNIPCEVVPQLEKNRQNQISFVATSSLNASIEAVRSASNNGYVILFSGINLYELNPPNKAEQILGESLEEVHRKELSVMEANALGKRVHLVGSSGYNFDDVHKSSIELHRHYEYYNKVQNVEIAGLSSYFAYYKISSKNHRFNIPAIEALMAPNGIDDQLFGPIIAETLKVLIHS